MWVALSMTNRRGVVFINIIYGLGALRCNIVYNFNMNNYIYFMLYHHNLPTYIDVSTLKTIIFNIIFLTQNTSG